MFPLSNNSPKNVKIEAYFEPLIREIAEKQRRWEMVIARG